MAEALGIAASGIAVTQLSIQVGGAVFKLKQLWDEVKDVPEDIADLMEQIDCLDPVLWETENNFNQGALPSIVWDELASKTTTMYCRKALHNLTQMVDELSHQINNSSKYRKKMAAVKVLIKKDILKKLERRLENAVRMLMLAQQSYLVALTRVQPDIIVQRFAALTVQCNHAKSAMVEDLDAEANEQEQARPGTIKTQPTMHVNSRRPSRGPTKPGIFGQLLVGSYGSNFHLLFQAPIWLSRRSWELHSMKAHGSWQWNLRSYSIVPEGSEIFEMAKKKSPRDMQQLFDAGLASPYDQDEDGTTLLHSAVENHNFEMILYLISIGLDPLDPRRTLGAPYMESNTTLDSFKLLLADQSLAKVFTELDFREDEELRTTPPECTCRVGIFSLEMYRELLPYQCPLHQRTSLDSRISSAELAIEYGGSIEVVGDILQPEWNMNPKAVYTTGSLIYSVAARLSQCVCGYFIDDIWYHDNIEVWFQFAIKVIRHTPDIHHTSRTPICLWTGYGEATALTTLLFHTSWVLNLYIVLDKMCEPNALQKILVLWLKAVRQAGVDLDTYGKREHQLLVDSRVTQQCRLRLNFADTISVSVFRIVGFTYGPHPEDWEFFWNEPTDQFAGQFWRLIENPPLHIPGSWADDYDDDYRDYYVKDDEFVDWAYWCRTSDIGNGNK